MQSQKEVLLELNKLILENPELEVFPMVDYEVCGSDDHSYWKGNFSSVEKTVYFEHDETMYFGESEIAERIELFLDSDDLNTSALDDLYKEFESTGRIKEAIVVYIGT